MEFGVSAHTDGTGDPFIEALAERIDLLREPDEDYSNREDAIALLAWIDNALPPQVAALVVGMVEAGAGAVEAERAAA
jgi:hypothetical protein